MVAFLYSSPDGVGKISEISERESQQKLKEFLNGCKAKTKDNSRPLRAAVASNARHRFGISWRVQKSTKAPSPLRSAGAFHKPAHQEREGVAGVAGFINASRLLFVSL
jgi:hypothetical protein